MLIFQSEHLLTFHAAPSSESPHLDLDIKVVKNCGSLPLLHPSACKCAPRAPSCITAPLPRADSGQRMGERNIRLERRGRKRPRSLRNYRETQMRYERNLDAQSQAFNMDGTRKVYMVYIHFLFISCCCLGCLPWSRWA